MSIQNLKINPDELLSLWEKEGFESASEELVKFIQYGKQGESILDWNPLTTSSKTSNIDRGIIDSGKEHLLKYFLTNRYLTSIQKNRFLRLLSTIIPNESSNIEEIERLLSIWEKEGLDAAVKTWMRLTNGGKTKNQKLKKGLATKIGSSEKHLLDTMGISIEEFKEFAEIQKELEADSGNLIDLDFNWDDIPFNEITQK